jgi:predicted ATP-dependent endonuclease of OLD family
MKINFVEIQNFRKLKQCRIDLSDTTTLFVGANNSGKTSAMDSLGKFLAKRNFVFNDLTLSNFSVINKIGEKWEKIDCPIPETIEDWESILPSLDVWIEVSSNEIQYVTHIIPTLSWRGGALGVRYLFQPKDIKLIFKEYRESFFAARKTEAAAADAQISLWPKTLCDFLEKRFSTLFSLKAYLLDPTQTNDICPQKTTYEMECIEQNPLDGLIQIDMIAAQRGFSDPVSSTEYIPDNNSWNSLSSQLRNYYDKHLNPEKSPTPEDLSTLQAMESAKDVFNQNLKEKFQTAIDELETLGYPGVSDPKITIMTKVSATDAMKHDSAVLYSLTNGVEEILKLPEMYNGLGYQNLISMVFLLMRFRDDWMQVGKVKQNSELTGKRIAPLHLVLLEEPEAHLHVQVQQVFIKKVYEVLRNHEFLKLHSSFSTQLIVSAEPRCHSVAVLICQ